MSQTIQVITTVENTDQAKAIARTLLERRLAGCVQIIGPISSLYWWQGAIQEAEEHLCLIKTQIALYEAVEMAIKEVHPYTTPEILGVPATRGSQQYLDWLAGEINARGR